jgi:hypothetical protein
MPGIPPENRRPPGSNQFIAYFSNAVPDGASGGHRKQSSPELTSLLRGFRSHELRGLPAHDHQTHRTMNGQRFIVARSHVFGGRRCERETIARHSLSAFLSFPEK